MDDFREQCRRQLERSLEDRIKYGFFRTYKPILDDVDYRSFDTMREYREWAHRELPRYLGYRIVGRTHGHDEIPYEPIPFKGDFDEN